MVCRRCRHPPEIGPGNRTGTAVPPGAFRSSWTPALANEAIRLGRVLAALLPAEPEVLGLLALMLLHDALPGTPHRGNLKQQRSRIRPQPPFSSIESMLNAGNPRNCCMTSTTRCSRTLSTLPAGPSLTG
jgi:hypothetical protein